MKRTLSGIAPSGDGALHIGNYFGAVKQHIEAQEKNEETFFFIADYHAINVVNDKEQLENNIKQLVLNYIALGIDPSKTIFYRQSDIPAVCELQTILNNVTPLGLIKRAHAYKDKLQKNTNEDSINMGLFSYPILMAADILLYHATSVPVGKDQKQHLEMTRDIASFFNSTYGDYFNLPEPDIRENVAVVVGTDGERKMSKSLGNIISIFDSEDVIRKQIFSTFTDPDRLKPTDPGKVEGNTIFLYHDLLNDDKDEVKDLKIRYKEGKVGDVEVKEKLLIAHLNYFADARKRYNELKDNEAELVRILEEGKTKAQKIANQTMKEVRELVGLNVFK
ncbi:tryptophan--tRNA ligase [Candidatus Dojkabacteria bacterium]|uniref:Tryptophan--tRNA ligase n=1 Tax=Candidatus Dojkabacteria bacterium TaxID=2099670 RepID=A0A955L311_9BACT|nr:tryptophan--tRNA ligase [Candidatus Dojkabacteria bacterium]